MDESGNTGSGEESGYWGGKGWIIEDCLVDSGTGEEGVWLLASGWIVERKVSG